MNLYKLMTLPVIGMLITGCIPLKLPLDKISEKEAVKYEKEYIYELSNLIKKSLEAERNYTLYQPKNKKEECKIATYSNTAKPNYEMYWDGQCKDGLAYGLGREFESTMHGNSYQIGYYENGKVIDYCSVFHSSPLKTYRDGECIYDIKYKQVYYVSTVISESNGDIEVNYEIGLSNNLTEPGLVIMNYPFHSEARYFKSYPNFGYMITDFSNEEFSKIKYKFDIISMSSKGKSNGFIFAKTKDGQVVASESINGKHIRNVQLPDKYFQNANAIFSEIRDIEWPALKAQKYALGIKEKYKNKICIDSVKVDFMDNSKYKEICKEEEEFSKLKEKIDSKIAQINNKKEQKRQRQFQERVVRAKEVEAAAAVRQAAAAESQADAAEWANTLGNMQNMQIQQLNNNLMMYNILPKRHNIYFR